MKKLALLLLVLPLAACATKPQIACASFEGGIAGQCFDVSPSWSATPQTHWQMATGNGAFLAPAALAAVASNPEPGTWGGR